MAFINRIFACALIACLSGCIFDTTGLAPDDSNDLAAPDGFSATDHQQPGQEGTVADGGVVDADGMALDQGPKPLDQGPPLDKLLPMDKTPPADKAPPLPDQGPPCSGISCPLGCNLTLNRCYRLKPTGFPVQGIYASLTAVLGPGAPLSFNTDNGEVRASGAVIRSAGGAGTIKGGIYWATKQQASGNPEVAIFGINSMVLSSGQALTISGGRALALYAKGDVTIAGTLSAKASEMDPGPGGFKGGPKNGASGAACLGGEGKGGTEAGSGGYQAEAGGGGGGRKAAGGKGGQHTSPQTTGGAGGKAFGAASLAPGTGRRGRRGRSDPAQRAHAHHRRQRRFADAVHEHIRG